MIIRAACLMISSWVFMPQSFFFFISTTYPPSSEARASSCFEFFFLLLASDSYCRLEAISPPASNCLSVHLTADWWDVACCQSLWQHVRSDYSSLFFLSPASGWLVALCAPHCSNAHPLCISRKCIPLDKMGLPMDRGALHTVRVLRVGRGGGAPICSYSVAMPPGLPHTHLVAAWLLNQLQVFVLLFVSVHPQTERAQTDLECERCCMLCKLQSNCINLAVLITQRNNLLLHSLFIP